MAEAGALPGEPGPACAVLSLSALSIWLNYYNSSQREVLRYKLMAFCLHELGQHC